MPRSLSADVRQRAGLLSASPRVPPGGMTTASLSCASAMKLRPFSGSCTTSRFSMTSLISAVVAGAGAA